VAGLLFASCGQDVSPADTGNLGEVQRFKVPIGDETVFAEVRAIEVLPPAAEGGKSRIRCEVRLKRKDGGPAGVPTLDWKKEVWTAEIEEGETAQMDFGRIVVEKGVVPPLNAVRVTLSPVLDGPRRVSFDFEGNAFCVR
jgi:hypothetical protein